MTLTRCAAGDVAVLYDPDAVEGSTQTLDEQGFEKRTSDIFNQEGFCTPGDGVTDFYSGVGNELIAVFYTHGLFTGDKFHPEAQVLDRSDGFKFSIDLAIDSESHDAVGDKDGDGVVDGAGFTFAIVCSDLKGIGVAFWTDRVWVFEDDSDAESEMLTQAEGVAQSPAAMATLRRYDLEVKGDGYRLSVDGKVILTGLLRDYSNYLGTETPLGQLNNFDKPDSITIGDAIDTAHSAVRIGDITSETPFDPEPDEGAAAEIELLENGVSLRWDAIPGTLYSIRESDDLVGFFEFADYFATSFSGEFTDTRAMSDRKFYSVVPFSTP